MIWYIMNWDEFVVFKKKKTNYILFFIACVLISISAVENLDIFHYMACI